MIYLIFLIILFVVYFYDYSVYEKYEYHDFYKFFENDTQIMTKKKDPEYNPPTNFSFEVYNEYGKKLTENFSIIIYEPNRNKKEIKMNEIINKKADEFSIIVAFKCKGENCTDSYSDFFDEELNFNIYYESKIIDFESKDSPVKTKRFNLSIPFIVNNLIALYPKWEVYNYEEQKNIFSRLFDRFHDLKNNYSYGKIVDLQLHDFSKTKYNKIEYDKETDLEYAPTLSLKFINTLEGIHLFKRKALSIIDYLANIAALGTTILNLLTKIFEIIYSHKFDSYKIVEKILLKEIGKKKELNNINETNLNLELNLINMDLEENEDIFINDEKNNAINDIDDNEKEKITLLPKLKFYDFFFNLVYFKCCPLIKKQKLIDSCAQILYKYFSVENILYNQLMFENLLKDYHWNDPQLKSIHRNSLIEKLKKYIR